MVLFDVKSLLTFVPLEYIINIIIKRIFEDHEIIIFTKSEMKNLLILRTKTVHFSFNKEIYVQIDGGTWLSPLRHVIIMAELPKLKDRQTVQTFRRWYIFMSRIVQLHVFFQFLMHFIRTLNSPMRRTKQYFAVFTCLLEMMKTFIPLFIEKIHIMTCIYIGTSLLQLVA